jgi:hypothetical protein
MISTPAVPRAAPVALPTAWLAGLLASLCLCVAVAFSWLTWGWHAKVALLVVQYGLVLPAAIFFWRGAAVSSAAPVARGWWRASIVFFCCLVLPIAAFLGAAIYSGDESAYVFQARLFRDGKLSVDAPGEGPVPATSPLSDHAVRQRVFRYQHHLIHDGRWFGKYPPGWSALLAPAMSLQLERFVNPLAGLAILWVTWRIGLLLFNPMVAELALLILVASPFFTLSCVDFLSHASAGLLLALAVYCLLLAWQRNASDPSDHPPPRRSVGWYLGGMMLWLFFLCLVRPYVAAWTGSILGLGALWVMRFRARSSMLLIAAGGSTAALAVFALLAFNKLLTGAYWPYTYALYTGTVDIAEVAFTPSQLWANLTKLTSHSFGETVLASFPFVFPLSAFAVWRDRRRSKIVLLLAALVASLVVAYLGQSNSSFSLTGERYYFETFFLVALLAAWGWALLWQKRCFAAAKLVLAALLASQLMLYPVFLRRLVEAHEPARQVLSAVNQIQAQGAVVFLQNSRRFRAFDMNPNGPDWRHADLFVVADPGAELRGDVTCSVGRSRWIAVGYNDRSGLATVGPRNPVDCTAWKRN